MSVLCHERPICDVRSMSAYSESGHSATVCQQLRQLGDVDGDAPRLVVGERVIAAAMPRSLCT
jgi:hypothetical protein